MTKVTFSHLCHLCHLCDFRFCFGLRDSLVALGLLYEFLPVLLLRYVLTHYF